MDQQAQEQEQRQGDVCRAVQRPKKGKSDCQLQATVDSQELADTRSLPTLRTLLSELISRVSLKR